MDANKLPTNISPESTRLDTTYQREVQRVERLYDDAVERLETAQRRHESIDPANEEALYAGTALNVAVRAKVVRDLEVKREFLRPPSEADIEYRRRVERELPERIRSVVSPDSSLRFHGCPLATARDIIESGELSSSADRLGFESSLDGSGTISVTTRDTIKETLDTYSDLYADSCCTPAGCVFVLHADPGEGPAKIGNVYFRERPDKLRAIMTSDENLERVREWVKAKGIDPDKVVEFFSFRGDSLDE